MSGQWYYEHNGNEAGPLPWTALEQLLDSGFLDESTRIWKSGWKDWRSIGSVLDEKKYATATPTRKRKPMPRAVGPKVAKRQKVRNSILLAVGSLALILLVGGGLWQLLSPPSQPESTTAGEAGGGAAAATGDAGKQADLNPQASKAKTDQDNRNMARRLLGEIQEMENQTIAKIEQSAEIAVNIKQLTIAEDADFKSAKNARQVSPFKRSTKTVEEELLYQIELRQRSRPVASISAVLLSRIQRDFKAAQTDLKLMTERHQAKLKRLARLEEWSKMSFVLVNGQIAVVGIRETENGAAMRVVTKATGTEASEALRIVRNAAVPRIDRDRRLSRDVYRNVDEGEQVTAAIEERIRGYWKPYTFVKRPDGASDTRFVHFQELSSGSLRFGLFLGFEDDKLRYQPVGKRAVLVERDYVDRKTAKIESGPRMAQTLPVAAFLDYCILNMALALNSDSQTRRQDVDGKPNTKQAEGNSTYVRVAVHVDAAALRNDVEIYRKAIDANRSRKSPTESRDVKTSINRIRKFANVLTVLAGWSRPDAENFLLNVTKESELRKAAGVLEDQVFEKLVRLGIPILEREELEAVVMDDSELSPGTAEIRRRVGQANATHLISIELSPSNSANAAYRLSVRLTDVDNEVVKWAGEGDRFASRIELTQSFHLNSGRLATVTVPQRLRLDNKNAAPNSDKRRKSVGGQTSFVAYVAPSEKATEWSVREIGTSIPIKLQKSSVKNIKYIESGLDVPWRLSLNYAMAMIQSALLPPAGPIISVDKNVYIVGIGKRHGLRGGEQLYVVRANNSAQRPKDGVQEYLPVTLSVVEASDDRSRAVVGKTGFETWWPNTQIQKNDIAVVRRNGDLVVGVETCELVDPDTVIFTKFNFKNSVVRARLINETRQAAKRLQAYIETKLLDDYVAVATRKVAAPSDDDQKEIPSGRSHQLEGTITLSPLMAAGKGSASSLIFRVELIIRKTTSDQQIRRIAFDWDGLTARATLPSRR
jgi:hypothetical protein